MNARPTPNLDALYEQLNIEFFEGKLPKVPCRWNSRFSRTLGRVRFKKDAKTKEWKAVHIEISSTLSERHLHKTMVHEMCHVWSVLTHQSHGHSSIFWRKMKLCGYPDGHTFDEEGVETDKWQLTSHTNWKLRQRVFFDSKDGRTIEGFIIGINKRSITIQQMTEKRSRWRVSPSVLRKTAQKS